jgi:hypothetical protein
VRRGVRLGGDVSLHVGACGSCAQAHRRLRLRARARAVVLVPVGVVSLVDQRLRDLLASAAAHEAPLGTTAKLCAVACAGVAAGGSVAGVAPSGTPAPHAARLVPERPAVDSQGPALVRARDRPRRGSGEHQDAEPGRGAGPAAPQRLTAGAAGRDRRRRPVLCWEHH